MSAILHLARYPNPETVRGSEHVRLVVPRCPIFDFDDDNTKVPAVAELLAGGFRITGHTDLAVEAEAGQVVYDTRAGLYTG